jgi:hypothetical protein
MSKAFDLADRIHREQYGTSLTDWAILRRADGASWQTIADELWERVGVRVTDVTMSRWCDKVAS